MRSRSASAVSPGSDRARLLEDHRPGVDALVDEMDGDAGLRDAGSEGVLDRRRPGKAGRSDGWTLIAVKPLEEGRREQVHVPGADDQLDLGSAASRPSPGRAPPARRSPRAGRRPWGAPPARLGPARLRPRRSRRRRRSGALVDQRLQVRAACPRRGRRSLGPGDALDATSRPITGKQRSASAPGRRRRSRCRG